MRSNLSIENLYFILGDLAIWPALYTLGVYVLASGLILDRITGPGPMVFILLCAHSCYLLDRVKIADHRQDPADALALPYRSFLFARHSKLIRVIVTLELVAAMLVGWAVYPPLVIIPLPALGVVHLYAGRGADPDSPRLKDLPAIKAFIISSGHLALTIAVIWSDQHDLFSRLELGMVFPILGIWMIVAGDAVLCDIDDHHADRVYSTKSLAVLLGSRSAWTSALLLITLGSLMIVLNPHSKSFAIGIGATLIFTTLITHANPNHRDFVDARLLPIVLIWMWVLG